MENEPARSAAAAEREVTLRLAAIAELSEDAIIELTPEGIVRSWNAGATAMYGYPPQEMIGESITRLIPAERTAERASIVERLCRGESVNRLRTRRLRKDGTVLDVSVSSTPIQIGGSIVGVASVTRDLSGEARSAEVAARLAAIVTSSDDSIIGKTLDGEITSWNAGATAMYGYTTEEMIGRNISELIPADRAGELPRILKRLARGERVEPYETRRVRKDGTVLDVSVSVSPVLDPDGAVGGAESVVRDITAKVRAEAYQTLFEHSVDAVFFTAPDGRIFAANPAACAKFGYTEEELCARGRQGISDPDDRKRAAAMVAERAATGKILGVTSWRRRDGTTFPGEFTSAIYTDASGEQVTCAILRDISERERMEAQLADQLRRTQAANEELVSFTYYVSHDLRAPLRSMDGFSQALAEDYGDRLDDTARRLLDRIRGASQKMGALLEELFQWSRLGRAELHRVTVDLSAVARETAQQLQVSEPDRHVTFRIADGITGSADLGLIRTVLDNLLGNAWKYTARQPQPVIEFGATAAPSGPATYFVADNGAGFDPAYADMLFQPFQRLHGAEFAGTGLGLASVRRIVERHGGRISADAAIDHGATFSFTLHEQPG